METPRAKRTPASKVQDLEPVGSRGEVLNRPNKEVNKVWFCLVTGFAEEPRSNG